MQRLLFTLCAAAAAGAPPRPPPLPAPALPPPAPKYGMNCAWKDLPDTDRTFCNSDNKDWSPENADDPQRCGGLQGESVAGVCKSGRFDMPGDGYDSASLNFFGRNFLFAPVFVANQCPPCA